MPEETYSQPVLTPAEQAQAAQTTALQNVLATTGAFGLGGMLARGLLGRKYIFGRGRPEASTPRVPIVQVPEPLYRPRGKKKNAPARDVEEDYPEGYPLAKQAEPAKIPPAPSPGNSTLAGWGQGGFAKTPDEVPLYYPGMVAGALGGGLGGYKLMDLFMDWRRKKDLAEEVDASREEYREALTQQYPAAARAKKAGVKSAAQSLGEDLEQLAQLVEKSAALEVQLGSIKRAEGWGDMAARYSGLGLGLYGAAAVPAALLAGMTAYNYTADTSTNKLVEDAVRARRRQELQRRPPEVFLVPQSVPVDSRGRLKRPPEEDEDTPPVKTRTR